MTKTSLRLLAEENGLDGEEMLLGPESFGAMLDSYGVGSVPAPSNPTPGDEGYFSGGYITQRHGSRPPNPGVTDAIQLETPVTEDLPPVEMAQNMARAIVDFYRLYYEVGHRESASSSVNVVSSSVSLLSFALVVVTSYVCDFGVQI